MLELAIYTAVAVMRPDRGADLADDVAAQAFDLVNLVNVVQTASVSTANLACLLLARLATADAIVARQVGKTAVAGPCHIDRVEFR